MEAKERLIQHLGNGQLPSLRERMTPGGNDHPWLQPECLDMDAQFGRRWVTERHVNIFKP